MVSELINIFFYLLKWIAHVPQYWFHSWKKLNSSLKSQTIKICSDLDKKNKALIKENEDLIKKNEALTNDNDELKKTTNSEDVKKKTRFLQDKHLKVKEERNKAEEENVHLKNDVGRLMRQRNEDKTAEFKKENEVLSKELKKAREEEKLKGKEVISLQKLIETMGDDGDDEAEEDKEPETVKPDEPKAEEVKKPETVKPVDSKAAEVKKPEDNEPVDLTSNFNNDNVGSATANEESTVKPPAVVEKEVAPKPTKEASKAVELPDETIEVVTSEEEWEGTTYYKIA